VRAKAESLPRDRRVLVTSHDAFGYFGAAYGFEVHGLQGVSTASETTTKDVQDLAAFLGTRKIPAVFGETSVPPKGLQAVLDAVKGKYGHDVRLIGGDDALYSDALGEPGTPGETYAGMVRHNIDVIVGALGK
jgi:manganese/zinc/iron transport system substrate-binding protein